jgi:UDP-N-acetylmuramoylalanine--D-glutamate ligase
MGLGRFGGGVGVCRYLASQGADVLLTDLQPAEKLIASLKALGDLPITYRLGQHNVADFTTADLIIVNPAVNPQTNRFCRAARAGGVPLSSEIRLLIQALPNPKRTIGVTGTAGKSTVTAMVGHILAKHHVAAHVGGNIGGSLLGRLDQIAHDDWIVLELSSFMLQGLDEDRWSPHIAVVTNCTANHLDWHGDFDNYVAAKQTILRHQTVTDCAILHESVAHWPGVARQCVFGSPATPYPLLLPGEHNQDNAHAAAMVCLRILGAEVDVFDSLSDFADLPHRLQWVAEHHGVRYYNDSKSTTPESALRALNSFPPDTLHVILGGYDKGSDLTPLAQAAAKHCRAIYCIGATGSAIFQAAQGGKAVVIDCDRLDRAMNAITQHLADGQIVLLSPGCASWDQFDSFEQRGEQFILAIGQGLRASQ